MFSYHPFCKELTVVYEEVFLPFLEQSCEVGEAEKVTGPKLTKITVPSWLLAAVSSTTSTV